MSGSDLDLAADMVAAAAKAGADAADALVVEAVSNGVGVSGAALEEAERSEGKDLGLRVFLGKRQACVAISDTRAEAIREMAERAVAMAREAPEDPHCGLAGPDQITDIRDAAGLELSDPALFPDAGQLEEMALAVEAAALSVEGVVQVEQASASWGRERVTIAQSNGFAGGYARSSIGMGVSAIAGTGLGRESDHAYESRRFFKDLPSPESIGKLAGERTVARLSPRKSPAGRWPVLYDERISAGLIGHLLGAINGSSIARGSSWLRDAMETQVLPGELDLWEDPLIPRGSATRPFDAEGIAAAPRDLISNGVLKSWTLDLATARKLGLETTGNARRGAGGPPSPGVSNIRMTTGSMSREALVAEMGTGLIITSMIGSSINPTTGAYSRGASGFWVEDGEIAYPVNEITVAGSLPEMMLTIRAANDADPTKAVSVPSLLVEGVTLGA